MIRAAFLVAGVLLFASTTAIADPVAYARFLVDGAIKVGEVRGDRVVEIEGGGLFGARKATKRSHALGNIKLLAPVASGRFSLSA